MCWYPSQNLLFFAATVSSLPFASLQQSRPVRGSELVSTLRPLRRLRRHHRDDPQGPDSRLRVDAKNVGHGEILNSADLVLILKIRLPVIASNLQIC